MTKTEKLYTQQEYDAVVAQKEQAELTGQRKSDLLASVAHDLRTPVHGIRSFAEMIGDMAEDDMSRECAGRILVAGEHLLSLVNLLLDLSKIEAGQMDINYAQEDLFAVLDGIEKLHQAHAKDKGVVVSGDYASDLPATFSTDVMRMRQILNNLLNNAVKCTDGGGSVSLRVTRSGEFLVFDVIDTGCGIAAEDISNLFGRYKQVKANGKRNRGGTGLGLALVQELSELMGGRASVASEVGKGSVFTVRLPM